MNQRIFSILLTLALLLGLCPLSVWAVEAEDEPAVELEKEPEAEDIKLTSTSATGDWLTVEGIEGGRIRFDSSTGTITDCEAVTVANIPETINGVRVTSIGDWAFWYCIGLTSITIPNSVTSIGDCAFYECTGLTSITIPNSVTSIGEGTFQSCYSLTSITIPNSVTSIGEGTFHDCISLTSIQVADKNPNYSSLNGVLFNKSQTILVAYPSGGAISYSIPNSVTSIGDFAFYRCYNLTSITIPNSVTNIGHRAFAHCSLTSTTIPNSVMSIGNGAFSYCSDLTSITIPNNVTSIGFDAFYECISLTSITIPNNVTSIMDGAFYYCTSLKDVYYTGTESQWKAISITAGNEYLENATIHYNSGSTPFKVTFDENYKGGNHAYDCQYVYNESAIVKPKDPVRDGYSFEGWYINTAGFGSQPFFNDFVKVKHGITSNTTLYAKWKKKDFWLPGCVFPFKNTYQDFCCKNYSDLSEDEKNRYKYDISDSDYEKLLKNCSVADSWLFLNTKSTLKEKRESHWDGSCFGISAVTCLNAADSINLSRYTNNYTSISNTTMTMNKNGKYDVGKVESLINFYQLIQYTGHFDFKTISINKTKQIVNRLEKHMTDGTPAALLGLTIYEDGKNIGGHAVVVYNLKYNEITSQYTMDVYDCSLSNEKSYPLKITKNGNNYPVECTEWENAWKNPKNGKERNIEITYLLTVDDFLEMDSLLLSNGETTDDLLMDAHLLSNEETAEGNYTCSVNYSSFTIFDGLNTTAIEDGGVVGEDAIGLSSFCTKNDVGAPLELQFEIPALENGSYTITPTGEASEEEYTTTINSDATEGGFFHSVHAANAGAVMISEDGTLSTSYSAETEQNYLSAFSDATTDWEMLETSCSGTGMTTALVDGSLKLIPASEETLEVTKIRDLNEVSETMEVGTEGVTLADTSLGYAVVFDTGTGSAVESQTGISSGSLAQKPEDPTREGYDFAGWYQDESCTESWDFSINTVSEDVILYASWTPTEGYWHTVTLCAEGLDDQTMIVPNGGTLSAEAIPTEMEYISLNWNEEELSALLSSGIYEDVTLHGTALPTFGSCSIQSLAVSNESTVQAVLENSCGMDLPVQAYLATYNEEGKLLSVSRQDITIERGEAQTLELNCSNTDQNTKIKLFILNDKNTPLCESKTC